MPWIWDKEDKFVIEKFDLWYKFHGHPPRRCRDSDARRRTRSHAGGNGPGSAPQAEHAPGASAHCLSEAYVCASLSESARVARVCTVCTSPSRTMACTLCALACRGGPERESTKKSSACYRLCINRPVGDSLSVQPFRCDHRSLSITTIISRVCVRQSTASRKSKVGTTLHRQYAA